MKTIMMLMISCTLLERVQAQIPASATNRVSVAEATKIVSGLRVRMKEDDADKYLLNHGINARVYDTNGAVLIYRQSVGDNFFWTTGYPLKAPFSLGLEYSNAYGLERNGLLEDAIIYSNNLFVTSITFTNSK